ncbi:MAG: L-threonylcarbamoyladenylate synthase [Gemmataceae bacterium]
MTTTRVVDVSGSAGLQQGLREAVRILREGGVVAFPTETVYGLGADARNPDAVREIFRIKGRPAVNPVIVHVPDAQLARELVTAWPRQAEILAERFWPGPLSMVLPKKNEVPDVVTAGGPTVALRVPAHPVARALLCESRLALAAPSANRSCHLSPTRAEHVLGDLRDRIPLILDGGQTSGGLESTVVDLSRDPPRLLRPGLISPGEIEQIIGPIQRGGSEDRPSVLASPGLLERHYAPRTLLEVAEPAEIHRRLAELDRQGLRFAVVSHQALEGLPVGDRFILLGGDPVAYSRDFYATLHWLDHQGLDRIVVCQLPAGEDWLALRDRLRRAAHPG